MPPLFIEETLLLFFLASFGFSEVWALGIIISQCALGLAGGEWWGGEGLAAAGRMGTGLLGAGDDGLGVDLLHSDNTHSNLSAEHEENLFL